VKRDWTVPIDLPERAADGPPYTPVDPSEAQQAFVDCEAMLRHLGGTLLIAPHRAEVSPDRWITLGYQFRHESYVPAIKQRPEEEAEEITPAEAMEHEFAEAS
jgi:hypothetical protein